MSYNLTLSYLILFCLSFSGIAINPASAKPTTPKKNQQTETIVEVRTVSIQSYREQQVKYCLDAVSLNKAQSIGRLTRTPAGISVNACSQLLQKDGCRDAFNKAGHNGAMKRVRFQKITRTCAIEYCSSFRRGDFERICAPGIQEKNDAWRESFYTTAIRHELLEFDGLKHLASASSMAQGILVHR